MASSKIKKMVQNSEKKQEKELYLELIFSVKDFHYWTLQGIRDGQDFLKIIIPSNDNGEFLSPEISGRITDHVQEELDEQMPQH